MHRVTTTQPHALFDVAATRRIEEAAAASLPAHALMQRAGLRAAQLAMAIAPHARTAWVACGPGNNGGDGLEAAMHLRRWGRDVTVTWLGSEAGTPPDALASLRRAQDAGVAFAGEPPAQFGLCMDALLGIGASRPAEGRMAQWIALMNCGGAPVLAIDIPSGLAADTGCVQGPCIQADHTLTLLTLKPGLFTGSGRDAAGSIWFDDLGIAAPEAGLPEPAARLCNAPDTVQRLHASHKGTHGDVAIIGGAKGMTGAALLAASAALHAGSGRVLVGLLDGGSMGVDVAHPELMFRPVDSLDFRSMAVACGCGGGTDAVRAVLPRACSTAGRLVLDADALNAIAQDSQLQAVLAARAARGAPAVITPHPLEAARLLGTSTADVQANRLAAARELAGRFNCTAVLKGSGTVIAAPGKVSAINPTGNARLATAGTGDVLAGLIAARLATGMPAFQAACESVWLHGSAADHWPEGRALTASRLARSFSA